MRRRDFLSSAAAAAVVATWPRFLSRAFADKACAPDSGAQAVVVLASAWKRAQQAGKPLLVLVVPDAEDESWARGHAWGELLNHGTAEQLVPLALAEVACAKMADLRQLVPSAGRGAPLAVLVDTDRVPARVEPLEVALPPLPSGLFQDVDDARGGDPDAVIARRQTLLAEMIRGALAPNVQVLAFRAERVKQRLAAVDRTTLETFLAKDTFLPAALVDRGAAILLEATRSRPVNVERIMGLLGDAVRARLVTEPPAGAHWATSSGCGTDVEETKAEREKREAAEKAGVFDSVMISVGCGMGSIPEKSRRFLYFFAVEHPGTQIP